MDERYWRLKCLTEDQLVYGWSSSKPTQCFNNSSHSIDVKSIVNIKRKGWIRLGESVSINDVLYLGSDGKYYKAIVSDVNKMPAVCFAGNAGSADEYIPSIASGTISRFNDLIPGKRYYVSHQTPGAIIDINPRFGSNVSQAVGEAVSSTKLIVRIQTVEMAAELPQIHWSDATASANSLSWERLGDIIYPGNSVCKTPMTCRIICRVSNSDFYGKARIYDITNNKMICESEQFNNTAASVLTITGIENVPFDSAVWQIQAKRIGGNLSRVVYVTCVMLG